MKKLIENLKGIWKNAKSYWFYERFDFILIALSVLGIVVVSTFIFALLYSASRVNWASFSQLSEQKLGHFLFILFVIITLAYFVFSDIHRSPRKQIFTLRTFSIRSISFIDLFILATSSEDRADAIKEYYDWNHATILSLMKMILGFLLGKIALLIELSRSFIQEPRSFLTDDQELILRLILGIALFILVIIQVILLGKLRTLPREYMDAVKVYSLLRG